MDKAPTAPAPVPFRQAGSLRAARKVVVLGRRQSVRVGSG